MTSGEPPRSPFKPGYEPPGEPGSPFAPDYDPARWAEPRLGIIHLLAATTCVAVYFGLFQTAQLITADLADQSDTRLVSEASSVLYGLGSGLALSGLLLWLARRWRGVPFPRHPGEYMLVVQAVACFVNLGVHFLLAHLWALSEQETSTFYFYPWWRVIRLVQCLTYAALWMVADLRVGHRRWQTFFFLCAASQLLLGLLALGEIERFGAVFRVPYMLLTIVLVVIVVRDHRQGLRFPWSHWLSVGIRFWFTLLSLWWLVLETFFEHWLRTGT
jgi:hypothetical protein